MKKRGSQSLKMLPTRSLVEHGRNVRDHVGDVSEMAASIKAHGILQPLVVTEHPTRQYHYLVLAGHRRRAAALEAGVEMVPCIVRHDLGADETVHTALMLVENTQRAQLTPLERARAIGRLIDAGLNQTQVARLLGMRPSGVNQFVLLLEVDQETAAAVEAGEVTATEAREAVRRTRAEQRKRKGTAVRGRPTVVEPAHLANRHPLADTARALCDHSTRPQVGKVACGECWESVIRTDERSRP